MHVKSLKPGVLIKQTCCRKGVLRFTGDTLIMHPYFVDVAQKVNRAKIIDKKYVFERVPFLLAAVIQLSVEFVARTVNGTFYAVMDKKGGRIRRMRWFFMRRFFMRRFFLQSLRQFVGSACRKEVLL